MQVKDKVAIVTGGATGIGKAIALMLAQEGAKVMIDYIGDEAPAKALVEKIEKFGGRAEACTGDVTKPDETERLMAKTSKCFGGIDVLVNNAGVEKKMPFLETPLETFHHVLATNLTGVWLCSQNAARYMVRQKRGGRIVNVSSVHEDLAMPTNAPYCAAKGGVRMLMRTLAVELAEYGITLNNVCPGAVDTPMDEAIKKDPKEYKALLSEIPLRRMGRPEEVASLVCYLASDAGAYITGSSYFIDGGLIRQAESL